MDTAHAVREKKLAALGSVFAAVVLVSLKVFLAAATGSLGVLSEALHSGLDLIAAVLTLAGRAHLAWGPPAHLAGAGFPAPASRPRTALVSGLAGGGSAIALFFTAS